MIISKFSPLFPVWYMCVTILYCACSISAVADYSILSNVAGAFPFADGIGPTSRFNSPAGVAISPDGSFALITDATNHNIRMMLIPSFNVTTLAGVAFTPGSRNGIGSNATFNKPYGVSISPDGSYALIADTGNNLIRKLVISSRVVTTFAESFNSPAGVAISPDGLFALVTDTENRIIRQLTIVDITEFPTFTPSSEPTFEPSSNPTFTPSSEPTFVPSSEPTFVPSSEPTFTPSSDPTFEPSSNPTFTPSSEPTFVPSSEPTFTPSSNPTFTPSSDPTFEPSSNPTFTPSSEPTFVPSSEPTFTPSSDPTFTPSSNPTFIPSSDPTFEPSSNPTFTPSSDPTFEPSSNPTFIPSSNPTFSPSFYPTFFPTPPSLSNGNITSSTIGGIPGTIGTTGTSYNFNYPHGIGISPDGSYALIGDSQNHMIRKLIISTLSISLFAGSASATSGSANGVGTSASFVIPRGIAISPDGSYALVADSNNNVIRKIILSTASVSTFVGTVGTQGSSGGVGISSSFKIPNGVAISSDGSFALVVDSGNSLIRKIVISTSTVSTIAGSAGSSGSTNGIGTYARFGNPNGISISPDGSFALIGDYLNHLIRKIVISTSTVSTIAGSAGSSGSTNGIGTNAKFNNPFGVSISPEGSYALIGDVNNHLIRKIVISTSTVSTIAGVAGSSGSTNGIGTNAKYNGPAAVTISPDGSFALIGDSLNQIIRKIQVASSPTSSPSLVPTRKPT